MAPFPSDAWVAELLSLVNADPDAGSVGAGWTGSLGVVVEQELPLLEQDFVVVLHPEGGRLSRTDRCRGKLRTGGRFRGWKAMPTGRPMPWSATR